MKPKATSQTQRNCLVRYLIALLLVLPAYLAAGDWGSATFNSSGDGELTITNGVISATWRMQVFGDGNRTHCVKDFRVAGTGMNVAGTQLMAPWITADVGSGRLVSANVVEDTDLLIAVDAQWENVSRKITVYQDLPLLKIDYLSWGVCEPSFVNAVLSTYRIYGQDEWQALRMQYPETDGGGNDHHARTHDLFTSYPNPYIDTPDWGEPAPTPLVYKGYYIMGLFSASQPVAFGMLYAADAIPYLKLLNFGEAGFEVFPYWRSSNNGPFDGYMFLAEGGASAADNIISMGMEIADWAAGGPWPGATAAARPNTGSVAREGGDGIVIEGCTLRVTGSGAHRVDVVRLDGSKAASLTVSGGRAHRIAVDDVRPGTYVVRISGAGGVTGRRVVFTGGSR